MHRSFVLFFFALFSFWTLSTACGGQVIYPPTDDGGGGSSSGSSSSTAADSGGDGGTDFFPVCPPDPPTPGTTCTTPHQGCRYVQIGGGCEAYACDGTWRNAPEGC